MKNSERNMLIVGAVILGLIIFMSNPLQITLPGITLNPPAGNGDGGSSTPPPSTPPPTTPPPETSSQPTSMTAFVSPNPLRLGGWVVGTVSSNGYNVPISISAKHKGQASTQTIPAFLGGDGKYELAQQMNTAGYWEFQATAENGVKSNVATLTVEGINIVPEYDHYSKTFRDSLKMEVFSHYKGETMSVVAHNHAGGYSVPIASVSINIGGYGSISPNLDSLSNGDYELDVIFGSDSATAWGGTSWISVGR